LCFRSGLIIRNDDINFNIFYHNIIYFCVIKKFIIMSNPVVWFEIAATDLERAKIFYSEVFQLKMQYVDMPGSPMYMMGSSAEGVSGSGGALVQSADNKPSSDGTMIYFYCDDVAVESSRVEGAGGTLIVPKTSLGEFGFMAMFIDTEGNKVGMHSMA
jgi:uncharacterized protein